MGKKHRCLCRQSSCVKDGLPGQVGILSDKTVQFVSNPAAFVERSCEELGSRVFACRLATKQTIVLADHAAITEFLATSQKHFRTGLSDFSELMPGIMFSDEATALELKKILLPLFSSEAVASYQPVLVRELESWSRNLDTAASLHLYEEFKNLSLAYNVNIFMGVDKESSPQLFSRIKDLASTHWHGFVSLPTSFSVPFLGQGGYRRAMEARAQLLAIIKAELAATGSSFFDKFRLSLECDVMTEELLYNHMLMFSCALIPKAVGSVLVMFLETMDKWRHLQQEDGTLAEADLEAVLLEVMRLYPPFIGNIKIATEDASVGGYCCPAGTAVYYSFMGAMRDPATFPHPDQFQPDRWRHSGRDNKGILRTLWTDSEGWSLVLQKVPSEGS